MTCWEISNPSDRYTMMVDDLEVAAVACMLLGHGQYGLHELEGEEREVPIFLFGGHDEWSTATFGVPVRDLLKRVYEGPKREALIQALDSVLIGKPVDRRSYEKGLELIDDPEKRRAWRDHWHDERRSSMNDIGACAWGLAGQMKGKPDHG
jgi:hypothetical protein